MANNKVEWIGHYGSDITHGCSAWTSTKRKLTADKRKRLAAFLDRLAKEGHETPFEKSFLHFLVTTDIATHIHLLKHRVGVSINAESARYKEIKEDKYYLPEDWKVEPVLEGTRTWRETLQDYTEMGNRLYHECLKDLTPLLGRKRAKESARFFKTYNSQIQADISFNWRSFAHFQNLRNSPDAQSEVRKVAQLMLQIVRDLPEQPFEHTIIAFGLDDPQFYPEVAGG